MKKEENKINIRLKEKELKIIKNFIAQNGSLYVSEKDLIRNGINKIYSEIFLNETTNKLEKEINNLLNGEVNKIQKIMFDYTKMITEKNLILNNILKLLIHFDKEKLSAEKINEILEKHSLDDFKTNTKKLMNNDFKNNRHESKYEEEYE